MSANLYDGICDVKRQNDTLKAVVDGSAGRLKVALFFIYSKTFK